jgi:predicted transporter
VIYAAVFGSAILILPKIDPIKHPAAVQSFIQSGMTLHLFMAGLMTVWGWILLKQNKNQASKSRGWLILVLPCPVCVTVIFLSTAFLMTCFPDHPLVIGFGLYLAFLLITLVTLEVFRRYQKISPLSAESLLGGAMLAMAAYFLISVTVMPQFADLDKVYRLTRYQTTTQSNNTRQMLIFSVVFAFAFALGFGFTFSKIRRQT